MPATARQETKEGTPLEKRFMSSMRIEVEFNRSSNNLPTYVQEDSGNQSNTTKNA